MKRNKNIWDKYYTKEEKNYKFPDISMYDLLKKNNYNREKKIAINYFDNKMTFATFFNEIEKVAKAFSSIGVKEEDVVTLIMPNTPECVIAVLALNKIGAIANMVHPLSAEEEIKFFINDTNSKVILTIDICAEKIMNIIEQTEVYKVIITSASDSMPFLLGLGYEILEGWKIPRPKSDGFYMSYKEFIRNGFNTVQQEIKKYGKDQRAVIMHSGGTTGTPKSIVLTNGNFTSLALQIGMKFRFESEIVLGILPTFHAFGLGVTIYGPLAMGFEVVLIPKFNIKEFPKMLSKYKPTIIPGVPTLFEAMLKAKKMNKNNISQIKFLISGGDDLSDALADDIVSFLRKNGSFGKLEKGYGLTESCAAVIATLDVEDKHSNIGIPFPGNDVCFVKPNTIEEVEVGEEGEICISGPTIMEGYLNNEEENKTTLQLHDDGKIWLHTGDLGKVDENGIIHYIQRLKRMIISSGFNVYPSQIEKVLKTDSRIDNCVVVGQPHPYKVEVPVAYIVLKKDVKKDSKLKKELKALCIKNLARHSIPSKFEFKDELPKTLIGKIDFKSLQKKKGK